VFCALEKFYTDGKKELLQRYKKSQNIGYSILSYLYFKKAVGGETSTISMKRSLLEKILPLDIETDWITRADECLNWGSSICGAKKYYFHEPLIEYRVHDKNAYCGNSFEQNYLYSYQRINIENRFFNYLLKKYKIDEKSLLKSNITIKIINLSLLEYQSAQIKTFKMFKMYARLVLQSNLNFFKKIQNIKRLFFLYLSLKK
ncbi:hypothetical protein KKG72_06695, partial [bacterium]|nr:hypothetical protein [bacterium]